MIQNRDVRPGRDPREQQGSSNLGRRDPRPVAKRPELSRRSGFHAQGQPLGGAQILDPGTHRLQRIHHAIHRTTGQGFISSQLRPEPQTGDETSEEARRRPAVATIQRSGRRRPCRGQRPHSAGRLLEAGSQVREAPARAGDVEGSGQVVYRAGALGERRQDEKAVRNRLVARYADLNPRHRHHLLPPTRAGRPRCSSRLPRLPQDAPHSPLRPDDPPAPRILR